MGPQTLPFSKIMTMKKGLIEKFRLNYCWILSHSMLRNYMIKTASMELFWFSCFIGVDAANIN